MLQLSVSRVRQISPSHPLYGKKTYIPRMAAGTFRALAAVLRSLGVDAEVVPPADARTLELGGKHSTGDECYPLKVVLGDFLRIVEAPGFDASRTAFFFLPDKVPADSANILNTCDRCSTSSAIRRSLFSIPLVNRVTATSEKSATILPEALGAPFYRPTFFSRCCLRLARTKSPLVPATRSMKNALRVFAIPSKAVRASP